ncbi:MAG TPA: ABC transporter permease subunit [Burkholderiales bacterium]|nr:ABC transporter permease subunit [Burkholderiales bacterium]
MFAPARHNVLLALLPFILIAAVYLFFSQQRLADNPQDKLLPSLGQMADAVDRIALKPDPQSGDYILLVDTWASLKRIALGVGFAALAGLLAGLNMGLLPRVRSLLSPVITFVSMVPPLAILPILFISLGVDELSKVALIFLGVFPVIARDLMLTAGQIPREQVVKAITLGASQTTVIYRIVLPQILPRLIDNVRLCLGGAWLFLIAAEAIASTEGLGYRIFLVRRYLAMDTILPYVFWITALGFTADWLLRQLIIRRFRWYVATSS